MIRGSQADCVLALGFEKMAPGSLKSNWTDRVPPTAPLAMLIEETEEELGENHGPRNPRMFANAAVEYFKKYGGNVEHLAKIGTNVYILLVEILY